MDAAENIEKSMYTPGNVKNREVKKTKEELKQIAIDYRAKKVWTDRHGVHAFDFVMLLGSLDQATNLADLIQPYTDESGEECSGMIYEYLSKAAPLAVNGEPRFFSMQIMTSAEVRIFAKLIDELEEAEKAI